MVDISHKTHTHREAEAEAIVWLGKALCDQLLQNDSTTKGPIRQTCILAGIQAAKRTSEWIPLCHQVPLSSVRLTVDYLEEEARIWCEAKSAYATGVEMEALTAVSAAALTLYDMCKAVSKAIEVRNVRLLRKSGGKSGEYTA